MTIITYSATLSSGEVVTRTVDTDGYTVMNYTHLVEVTETYGDRRIYAAQWCTSEVNAHKAVRTLKAPRNAGSYTNIRIVLVTAQVTPDARRKRNPNRHLTELIQSGQVVVGGTYPLIELARMKSVEYAGGWLSLDALVRRIGTPGKELRGWVAVPATQDTPASATYTGQTLRPDASPTPTSAI